MASWVRRSAAPRVVERGSDREDLMGGQKGRDRDGDRRRANEMKRAFFGDRSSCQKPD